MQKIYYTEGPSSKENTDELLEAGANGVRLTFSYSTPEYQLDRARHIKQVGQKLSMTPYVIADLEGGGARLGEISIDGTNQSFEVDKDEVVEVVNEKTVALDIDKRLPIPDTNVFDSLAENDVLIIGDGNASFEIVFKDDKPFAKSRFAAVVEGRRGLFVQSDSFSPVCMTEKDWTDIEHIVKHTEYDAVAISFVSTVDDILQVKKIMDQHGSKQDLISKIETKQGVENIDDICKESDQVMVARGDLAYAIPWYEMPAAVDKIVSACKRNNTSFIMATQVAESMVRGNMLTRAEMTDLWHWKKEGVDGVLLSREIAWGDRPVEAIRTVRRLLDTEV